MEKFDLGAVLILAESGEYSLVAQALAPHSCYEAGPVTVGSPPQGEVVIPEALPVVCELRSTSAEFCLQMLTPVVFRSAPMKIGEGHNTIVVFLVHESEVVAAASIKLSEAINESDAARAALADLGLAGPLTVTGRPEGEPPAGVESTKQDDGGEAWPEAWYVRCDGHADGRRCGGPYRTQQAAEDARDAHNRAAHWGSRVAYVTHRNCWR